MLWQFLGPFPSDIQGVHSMQYLGGNKDIIDEQSMNKHVKIES